jgi:ABC-2 type transport system permease protein
MSVAGTWQLVRFHLRRDRLLLVWWVAGSVLLYWSQAVSTKALYPTQAEFDRAAASMSANAAFVAMAGPARALNTLGGQVAWQASAFGAIVAGLMSMFLVGRHTRAEEESGRADLVRASAVGREATLAAVGVVVLAANVLLGGLVTVSLVAYGLPAAGSVSLGLAAGLAGLVFGAVALVAAQLTGSARAVYGITGAVIAASYVARAVGDVGPGALSWWSPIGWGQAMRAYAGERWWPALLSVAATALLVAVAAALYRRRDVGAGLWADRAGPSSAPASLRGALGLAWRLQRASLLGWSLGLFLSGLSFGAMGDDVTDLVGDSQFSQDLFAQTGGSLLDGFYAVLVLMLGLLSAGFAVQSALRARGEELAGRAEPLLATALPRLRWAASHLTVTVLGTALVVLLAGSGLGVGYWAFTGDGEAAGRLVGATVPDVAPVLVLAAVTWLLYGLAPRWATGGWAALGFCAVVMVFGTSLRLPGWLVDVSPFAHLPLAPAQPFEVLPLVALVALAVALGGAGFLALGRRDLR